MFSLLSAPVNDTQLLKVLYRIAAILWMGYEEEAESLVFSLFSSSHQISSSVITTAFIRLVHRILNSQPIGGPDARWRVTTVNDANNSFDFARGGADGDSRFVAKQQDMQYLARRLWRRVVEAVEAGCKGPISGWIGASAVVSELFPPLESTDESSLRYLQRHHMLNALLAGAEVCECARVLYSRWSR